jgi:hypothetical protein
MCERIPGTSWFRRTGTSDLMKDIVIQHDWQSDCLYCVIERFRKCQSGNCYP